MPTYEYKCDCCGRIEEVVARIADAPSTIECEVCRGPMKRQLSVATFVLKGSGWARDGYTKGKP